jgi:ABC-type Fe3+ transport system substrate-binding protein
MRPDLQGPLPVKPTMSHRNHPFLRTMLAAAGLALAHAVPAPAQPAGGAASGIALYQGPDRAQRILQGAKKDRELTVYTSAPVDDYAVLSSAFEKKYGIKVRVWRSSSEKVQQRGVTEARASRFDVDVFDTNGPEMESLYREKILQEVKSPYLADLIPQAIMPHREWVGTRLNVFALAYNTRLVKKDELPKKWDDLADPRWKGRLGIEAADEDWLAGVVGVLGEDRGLKLFREIATKNGFSVRKGHTLLTQLVAAGEVPLALTVYNYKAEQLKNKGAPLDWFVIPPAIARANGIGVARRAPHPSAAVLFYDFMISDAQFLLLERDFVPTSRKIKTKLNQFPIKFVDPSEMLDNYAKWTKLYEEIVNRQGR